MRVSTQWRSVFLSGFILGLCAVSSVVGQTFSNWSPPVNVGTVNTSAFDG